MESYNLVYILCWLILMYSCRPSEQIKELPTKKCLIEKDKADQIVRFISKAIPEYKEKWGEEFIFDTTNCFIKRVGIHNLTHSPVTNTFKDRWTFKLENGCIYHFYALDPSLSFSHIAYIENNGKITFFESINCKDRGNSLEDVLNYLVPKLTNNPKKREILSRVKSYRDYYLSGAIDDIPVSLECNCEE